VYYDDLTPYRYSSTRLPEDGTVLLNFGWLDSEHDYPRGPAPKWLADCLLRFARGYPNATRGFHYCPFCQERSEVIMSIDGEPVHLGSAEIRVRGGETSFVAPNLVVHYVVAHGYQPPPPVVAALEETCGLR
jgi:hypothetical protein